DITPLVEGHTLVIPKKEIDYIFDMTPQALAALHVFAQRVAKGVQAAVPCRRIGVAVIGLEVPHAHIHLIPMNKVADMNFANPKITVPAERMQELAAAIAAQVPGGSGLPVPASATKSGTTPAADPNDATLAQLQKLTEGLEFTSESEAPLEPVSYAAPTGDLSDGQLLQALGEPEKAKVEKVELTLFLRNHTADAGKTGDVNVANRYKALQVYMKQELDGVQVYRVGTGPQVHVKIAVQQFTKTWLNLVAAGLLATPVAAQTLTLPKPVADQLQTVRPADLEAHVRYLADDRLRGRLPGTPGYQMAVDYVAAQFKKNGVAPAGDQGGYTQKVRLRRAFVEPGATLSYQPATGATQPLAYGPAITVYPNPGQPEVSVTNAQLVFAGYGISAPELKYDDYAGLDAKGKVVVVTRQAPKQFGDNERQYFTDVRTVLETAARHGAVGVLLASAHAEAKLPEFPKGVVSALGPDGQVVVSRTYAAGSAQLVGAIGPATLQQLFAGAATDTTRALGALRGGKAAPVALPGRLSAHYRSRYQDLDSYNVVGKLTGSDPILKNEYVVHSAHL
nr:hypothetical protein [Tanacetum cinerariifolium]